MRTAVAAASGQHGGSGRGCIMASHQLRQHAPAAPQLPVQHVFNECKFAGSAVLQGSAHINMPLSHQLHQHALAALQQLPLSLQAGLRTAPGVERHSSGTGNRIVQEAWRCVLKVSPCWPRKSRAKQPRAGIQRRCEQPWAAKQPAPQLAAPGRTSLSFHSASILPWYSSLTFTDCTEGTAGGAAGMGR